MAYIIVISVSAFLIALGNFLASGVYTFASFGTLLLTTALGVASIVVLDGILAFLLRRLPEKWFAPTLRAFFVSKKEARLYRRLGIRKWKKYVPELGCFTGFRKDKLRDARSAVYLGRFLLESNYGVAGHVAGALLGFLILCLPFLPPSVALPIALVNFILNLLPTAILRANTPALRHLYKQSLSAEGTERA